MHLPWLSPEDRNAFYSRFESTVTTNLVARHWGVIGRGAPASSGYTELYILDMRGLLLAVGTLRYLLKEQSTIFYRGQANHHAHLTPGVYRTREQLTSDEKNARVARLEARLTAITEAFDPVGTPEEREALAQHYGLPTRCLDVVDHVQTAAWFACNSDEISTRDAAGHIYILAVDHDEHYARAVDLRCKPSNWLRPHLQQAYMLFPGPRSSNQSDFNYACVAHFIIPKPLLRIWSNYESLNPAMMCPKSDKDQGAYYWETAVDILRRQGLAPSDGPIRP